jgi:hypothetical protein
MGRAEATIYCSKADLAIFKESANLLLGLALLKGADYAVE